ncbi:MAG TPA: DUF1223 domain-containing protein [Terriglobales bacterium]|nr:DUF1223 domain-containing protein [Terriglobales bacterium]
MKQILFFLVVAAIVSTGGELSAAERVPVVVELFTSEGCSSCPPADALLASLARDRSDSVEIIALGEHVDYWNELGWKDRFSAHQYSARQEDYARHFGLGSVYTPQMVIDGRRQFVGNDQAKAREVIVAASRSKKSVEVTLELKGDVLNIAVKQNGTSSAVVLLAITEDNLTTEVRAGENGGRRLTHQAVVRSLRQIGMLNGMAFAASEGLQLNPGWARSNLRVLVLAQDPASGAIVGAAALNLR